MDPRTRWLTLHDYLTRASSHLDRGSAAEALQLVDAALRLDPEFLAARALRETILEQSTRKSSSRTAVEPQVVAEPQVAVGPTRFPPAPSDPDLWLNPDARSADAVDSRPADPPATADPEVAGATFSFFDMPPQATVAVQSAWDDAARERRTDGCVASARKKMTEGRLIGARLLLAEAQSRSPERMDVALAFAELAVLERRRAVWPWRLASVAIVLLALTAAGWYRLRTGERTGSSNTTMVRSAPPPAARSSTPPAPVAPPTPAAPSQTPPERTERSIPVRAAVPVLTEGEAATLSGSRAASPPSQPGRPPVITPPAAAPPPPSAPVSRTPDVPAEPAMPSGLATIEPVSPNADRAAPVARLPEPGAATAVNARASSPPAPVDDERLVRDALQRYRAAYDALDAGSAQSVWPSVNRDALARAFADLVVQQLRFETCGVDVRGASANATCRGTARYVPRVGARDERTEPRVWTFALHKSGLSWLIDSARVEPLGVPVP